MKTEPDPLGDEFLRPLKDPPQQDELSQKTQCLNESDKLQADNLSKQLSAVSCKIVSMPIICPLCNKTFLNTTSLLEHERVHGGQQVWPITQFFLVCIFCRKNHLLAWRANQ